MCDTGNESNEHFLLHCPLFDKSCRDLFCHPGDIPPLDLSVLDNEALCNLSLFRDEELNIVSNRMIQEATISFIEKN